MRKKVLKIFFLTLTFFILLSEALAAPSIDSATSNVVDGQNVTISGDSFGTKYVSSPFYYSTFENDIVGQIPSGQITNVPEWGTTQISQAHSGTRSLRFDYCADANSQNWYGNADFIAGEIVNYNGEKYTVIADVSAGGSAPDQDSVHYVLGWPEAVCGNNKKQSDWKRNVIDLGVEGSDKIYLSAWIHASRANSTSRQMVQWKMFRVTSNPNMYHVAADHDTTFFDTWFLPNGEWKNNGYPNMYHGLNRVISNSSQVDTFLWDQWHRVEFYLERSSAASVADGKIYFNRIGRSSPVTNQSNLITNDELKYTWRYVALSHALESVYDGFTELTVNMDDIYLDKTQARVEICDSSTWSSRTHCEIQIPTSWNETQVQITANKGSFPDGQVYLFVIDENGDISEGYPVTFTSCADVTAPAAPSGLSVN